jgi:hypothetical protein
MVLIGVPGLPQPMMSRWVFVVRAFGGCVVC